MGKILILSGAGLSAESGIKTFRASDGMWEEHDVMEVCSVEGFIKDREKVLDFYDKRRKDIQKREPNPAHFMITELKAKYSDRIIVITQNVDNLLEKSGCKEVIHLHGKLTELYCEMCGTVFDIGYSSIKEHSGCPSCDSHAIRHNVVMFGEPAPLYQNLYNTLMNTELLVVVGTSGLVLPVDQFASYTKYTVLNNLEKSYGINDTAFDHVFYENATTAAPKIRKLIEQFIETGSI